MIMEFLVKLAKLGEELDSLNADSISTTTSQGDKNIVRYELRGYDKTKETSTSSDGDSYHIAINLDNNDESKKPESYEPDYVEGQLDRFAPGTYIEVTRLNPIYMGDGLFGFTYLGTNKAFVRGDLKGEALKLVRDHEVRGHQILGLEEHDTRDATGTHMSHFLPLYNAMRLRNY